MNVRRTSFAAPRSPSRARALVSVLGLVLGLTGCQASVKASVKTSTDEPSTFSDTPPSAATSTPVTSPAPAPTVASAPPADACPLSCFEANGASRADVTADEQTQLRSALEPVLSQMRGCTSPEDWRRHGSPVINLRIAPDGTLADLGVDPARHGDSACFDAPGRGANVSLSLPGRKVVRCTERCQAPTTTRRRRR